MGSNLPDPGSLVLRCGDQGQPLPESLQQRQNDLLRASMVERRFKTRIQVAFADGGEAVVAFGRQSPERIGIVVRAWGLLYRRDVRSWERTSIPPQYWYDGKKRHMCRFDDPICCDLLEMLIPMAIAFQRRQREVLALRKRGCKIGDIARRFKMPVSAVSKMLEESAAKLPPS